MSKVERYVPLGVSSLSSDAPGWNSNSSKFNVHKDNTEKVPDPNHGGPVCWKCKGSGSIVDRTSMKKKKKKEKAQKQKKQEKQQLNEEKEEGHIINKRRKTEAFNSNDEKNEHDDDCKNNNEIKNHNINTTSESLLQTSLTPKSQSSSSHSPPQKTCKVCKGTGILQQKQKELKSLHKPGMITRIRQCPDGWKPFGPISHGLQQMKDFMIQYNEDSLKNDNKNNLHPLKLLHDANMNENENKNNTMKRKDNNVGDNDNIINSNSNKEGIFLPKASDVGDDIISLYPWLPINPGEQVCCTLFLFFFPRKR